MQYEKANEKISVTAMETSSPSTIADYRKNSDIRKTRTIVLVLLGIQLVFAVAYFIDKCVDLSEYFDLSYAKREKEGVASYVASIVAAGVSAVYLTLFIIIVMKYLRIPILVFGWLGLIHLIIILIIIIIAIIGIIAVAAGLHHAIIGIAISVVVIIVAAILFIFTILTVIFSFKLAKLIGMQEAYELL